MVKELKDMGIETVVSVWPTVDERSENFWEMNGKGYLVHSDRGNGLHMTWMGNTVFYDATHPGARKFVWENARRIIIRRASAFSGWMKRSRNTDLTI